MSRLINQLTGEPEEKEPAVPKPQQLELLGSLPLSIKDPPSITAPVPPRNQPLARNRNKTPGEPVLAPPEEMDRMRTALVDAEARARSAEAAVDRVRQEAESVRAALRQESEERMESLRLEVASLQDSRDGERKSRLAGEQRIRDLEEQLRSLSATPREESEEARQALDAAHTQLDDLRSQFRHLESSHETQSAQAEQRIRELTSALEREKRSQAEARRELTELQAEREDSDVGWLGNGGIPCAATAPIPLAASRAAPRAPAERPPILTSSPVMPATICGQSGLLAGPPTITARS